MTERECNELYAKVREQYIEITDKVYESNLPFNRSTCNRLGGFNYDGENKQFELRYKDIKVTVGASCGQALVCNSYVEVYDENNELMHIFTYINY